MRLPPWASFYAHSTYAELPEADLPNVPRELNPYERFWVRLAFADLRVLGIFAAAVPIGFLFVAWVIWPLAFPISIAAEIAWLVWIGHRRLR